MFNQDRIKKILAFLARKIIAKYQPYIIGITGSVGKTSTRHAIAAALAPRFKLREPVKNYNNEIGISLTIIGSQGIDETPGLIAKSFIFLKIVLKGLMVWLLPQNYPQMLVLEYGIDGPGDMDKYLQIARPNLTVLTTIGISHREFFSSEEEIAQEKGKLVEALPADGTYVYNIDDSYVAAQTSRTQAKKLSFGWAKLGKNPDVSLESITEVLSLNPSTTMQIKTPSRELHLSVPVLGKAHEQAILTAVAVAEALEVDTDFIIRGLQNYRPVPGRLNIVPGIKKTILIEDSYNAAPLSMTEALNLLARFPNSNKVAVLGDMLELGNETDAAHAQIGKLVKDLNIQKLITVGELGKKIAVGAEAAGMPADDIVSFDNSEKAKSFVLQNLEPDSVILVKGSQGARMEKISKELLAEPMSATQILPRQYGKWVE